MTLSERQTWQQLELKALREPQRFIEELDNLYPQHPRPNDARKLTILKAKALTALQDHSAAESVTLELLNEAIEANDLSCTAHCNIVLSKCSLALGMENREIPFLDVALTAAKQAMDNELIAEVLCHYASVYVRKRDRDKALNYMERAQKQLSGDSDPSIRLRVLIDTGTVFYRFHYFDKALPFIKSALELSERLGDIDNHLMLLNNASTLYSQLGQYAQAESVLTQGLTISAEHSFPYQQVQFLFGLGTLFMRMNKPDLALDRLLECEKAGSAIKLADPKFLSDLYSNLAGCHRYLNQNELAWARLKQAKEVLERTGNKAGLMELDINTANYLISVGSYRESLKLLQKVLKFAKKNSNYNAQIIALLNVHLAYQALGDSQKSTNTLMDLHYLHEEYHKYLMSEQARNYDTHIRQITQEHQIVEQQYRNLRRDIRHIETGDFVGRGPAHAKVLETALQAAQHPKASVLITGESGTGKDVLARIIHYNSARKDAPMVSVNMASISSTLLESEFFGHKKGSFTGAISDTKGLFMEADQGSLFLDEISEMPIQLQAKLLRVLESRTLTPVGGTKELTFDTRVISSTNQDIVKMVQKDLFRLDLYHRLNTIEIHIPPLRERPEDIEALILHYAEKLARDIKAPIPKIDRSFITSLQGYRFPGNVRELRNIIERLLIMQSGKSWNSGTLAKLPSLKLVDASLPIRDIKSRKANLEKKEIIEALQACEGKQKDAARLLGISESTLSRRINAYKLEIYTRKGR